MDFISFLFLFFCGFCESIPFLGKVEFYLPMVETDEMGKKVDSIGQIYFQ